MSLIANILIGAAIAATFLGGIALFWIARQDDSRLGRILGLAAVATTIIVSVYLTAGHHWL